MIFIIDRLLYIIENHRKERTMHKKIITLLLSVSLVISLVGCGSNDKEKEDSDKILSYKGQVNATIDDDSKWINSSIYGSIDSSLIVDEKDDFYTAINKEWLLSQEKPTEDNPDRNIFTECGDKTKSRLIAILSGEDDPEAFDEVQINIPSEEIEHDKAIVQQFASVASDWDTRNALGAKPLKEYIDAIENISSISEMSEYITDFEGANFSQESLLEIETIAGLTDADTYQTIIIPAGTYSLYDITPYMNMNMAGRKNKVVNEKKVTKVLSELGYSQEDIDRITRLCYRFEGMLADHINSTLMQSIDSFKQGHSLDELAAVAGNYPIQQVFEAMGYEKTDDFRMADLAYLRYLSKIYNDKNLALLKSYYIVHTINSAACLLDRDTYDIAQDVAQNYSLSDYTIGPDGNGDKTEQEIRDEWDLVLKNYMKEYLAGPMDIVYVSRYCSDEQKQEIEELVEDIVDHYHKMIEDEQWLSESAKEATNEKLDYLTVRVLYPDEFDSYMNLSFDENDNLLQMVQKIQLYNLRKLSGKSESAVDRRKWDLGEVPTSDANAYYKANDNSINILAGIISTGDMFDPNGIDEVNMARLGTVIGHEISHAFDSTGCYYDKYGNKNRWWDLDDLSEFQTHVTKISTYYSAIASYRGGSPLNGTRLTGEVIADMGGMSIMLKLANEHDNFDYDTFFRSYAQMWRDSCALGVELGIVQSDVHPPAFLRTNVTVMQFDEFMDTYNISEGDGMYLDKSKRIKIW